ncbi:MAG TPA: GntR family transcriptional regulator [Pseudonocardiaceae bacterium]|jgi:DNA-binding GntR family transcriptional regulator|nr:GntR family transcriptional regulator [Pseudonocardiaceae bacterium]
MTTPRGTRTEEVYAVLRADLLKGAFSPGQKLRVVELGERFAASQSVIREALLRLTEQDLLVAEPQRGFRVRDLSIDDIAAITETRVLVESQALRWSIERGDLAWETAVLGAHHRLDRTPVQTTDGSISEEWANRHSEFHAALLAGSGNPRIEAVAAALRDSSELYRRWYWGLTDDHQRDIPAEHRQLKDFALARDPGAAVDVLVRHIERAPCQLIAYAREHGLDRIA